MVSLLTCSETIYGIVETGHLIYYMYSLLVTVKL